MTIRRPTREDRVLKFRDGNGNITELPSGTKQFTGLHDKNGLEVWEGDTIRYFKDAAEVFFRSGSFCIYIADGMYLEVSQLCTEIELVKENG